MSGHTRPPWHTDGMLVRDSLDRVVAVVRLEQHESIIAESPRLLEALEGLADLAEDLSCDCLAEQPEQRLIASARAVIAKARGSS